MWRPDTHASACAFRSASVRANAFQTWRVKAYCFQTTSVRAYFFSTTHATACAFRTTSARAYAFQRTTARAFCLPDTECQGIFLSNDGRLDTVRHGISIDGCHRIYIRTALARAHAAPNPCQPCVCVLDKDGHRSSLRGDDFQSIAFSFCRRVFSMWRPDTHATACALRSASVRANAFQTRRVKAYFFQTTSVRAYFF